MISLFSAVAAAVTLVAAIAPPVSIPGQPKGEEGRFPAPPGYLLPWAGGEIHTVTQGEETSFTHNGATAYAYDLDLSYDTIVAARSGKVSMVREDSNSGGCNASFSSAANYVVIDHGDGTSSLYLHLAFNGVTVEAGDIVEQGDPIAISGETGLTCSDVDDGPGPHLHFQVQRTEPNRPISQSVPVAFDDIPINNGVPQDGRSYVSGNFGKGEPQKIKLTAWRVPRTFNPTARPADPELIQGELPPPPTPVATPDGATPDPQSIAASPTETPTEPPTITPSPDETRTPTPEPTRRPDDTATPVPAVPTITPVPDSPTPTPSDTPSPVPDTPVPTAGATEAATSESNAATVEPAPVANGTAPPP